MIRWLTWAGTCARSVILAAALGPPGAADQQPDHGGTAAPFLEIATMPAVGGGNGMSPVIARLEDDRLLLTWSAAAARTGVVGSFSADHGRTWSPPVDLPRFCAGSIVVARDRIVAMGNRALELPASCQALGIRIEGRFVWSADGSETGLYTGAEIWATASTDGGKTWSEARRLPCPYRYPSGITHAAIRLEDGTLFQGVSWDAVADRYGVCTQEGSDYRIGAMVSRDEGQTWSLVGELQAAYPDDPKAIGGVDEPSYVQLADGQIYLLARTGAGCLYESRSSDGGVTWSEAKPTRFAIHDSPSALCRLRSGQILLLGQDSGIGQMCIWASADDCRTWSGPRPLLESDQPGARYGSITEAADGTIVAAWAQCERPHDRVIKVGRFNRAWLAAP